MIFPYYIPAKDVSKPWIPVRLNYKKTHKVLPSNVIALIDSGADVCFCSEDIAFWLGSNKKGKEQKEFTTANKGKFNAYKDNFTLMACGKIYECPFYVSSELPRETPIILGQYGFFDKFSVKFNLPQKNIEIL
jgi:hypothetical protein